jgi:hypothetical protein
MVSPNYHSGAKFLVVDGNHRADWWLRADPTTRPEALKCAVFRGKYNV